MAAIVRFRAPVADVVRAAADLDPRDVAPDLRYAVVATSTMWWEGWRDEVGPDPTPVQGRTTAAHRTVLHACHFGLALGALLAHGSTAPVTSGEAEDTDRAIDLGRTWYRQVMGVSTSGLLDRSPVFAAATDVCLDVVADRLDEAPGLSDEQLKLLLAVCRHAVTDGAFPGHHRPSRLDHLTGDRTVDRDVIFAAAMSPWLETVTPHRLGVQGRDAGVLMHAVEHAGMATSFFATS